MFVNTSGQAVFRTLAALIRAVAIIGVVNSCGFVWGQETEAGESESTKSASVEQSIILRTQTPGWFDQEVDYDPESKMAFVKTSQSYLTKEEARICLADEVRKMAKRVVEERLAISNAESLGLDGERMLKDFLVEERLEFVEDLDCKRNAEQLEENIKFFLGFAQLELNASFDDYIQEKVAECRTKERLIRSGLVGGSLLSLLVVVFGYFKLENATRGFYSRRLQTGTFLLAMIVVLTAYLLSLQII